MSWQSSCSASLILRNKIVLNIRNGIREFSQDSWSWILGFIHSEHRDRERLPLWTCVQKHTRWLVSILVPGSGIHYSSGRPYTRLTPFTSFSSALLPGFAQDFNSGNLSLRFESNLTFGFVTGQSLENFGIIHPGIHIGWWAFDRMPADNKFQMILET